MSLAAMSCWREDLEPGHVVSFRFPLAERMRGAGRLAKRRPCLVLNVDRSGARPTATLAYGTGADTTANVGLELHVVGEAERVAAGVLKPTRFVGVSRMTIRLDDEAFALNAAGTPILGRLDGQGCDRLTAILAILATPEGARALPHRRRRRRRMGEGRRVEDAARKAAAVRYDTAADPAA